MENLHYVEEHFKEEEEDCGDVIVVCDENQRGQSTLIFLETFVFKLTSHPKSASAIVTAKPDFFLENNMSCIW